MFLPFNFLLTPSSPIHSTLPTFNFPHENITFCYPSYSVFIYIFSQLFPLCLSLHGCCTPFDLGASFGEMAMAGVSSSLFLSISSLHPLYCCLHSHLPFNPIHISIYLQCHITTGHTQCLVSPPCLSVHPPHPYLSPIFLNPLYHLSLPTVALILYRSIFLPFPMHLSILLILIFHHSSSTLMIHNHPLQPLL